MHLQRIKIGSFKNLKDVEITFSEVFQSAREGPIDKPIRSHAVIGQNGTYCFAMILSLQGWLHE